MDKNTYNSTNYSSDSPKKNTLNLVQNTPSKMRQKSWKKRWGFFVFPLLVIVVAVISYGVYTKLFALSSPYTPDMGILDPGCAPTDPNCFVQIYPNQAGQGGKILSTDGTNTTWVGNNGGPFNGGTVSQSGWSGVSNTNYTSTSLQDFISQVFFPAAGANVTLNSGSDKEVGSTQSFNLSWSVTAGNTAVTAINFYGTGGSTICGNTPATSAPGTTLTTIVASSGCTPTSVSGGTQTGVYSANVPGGINTTLGGSATYHVYVTDGHTSGSAPLSPYDKNATIHYYPKIYYGVSNIDFTDISGCDTSCYNNPSTGILSLSNSAIMASRTSAGVGSTFTNPKTYTPSAQYVYYVIPTGYNPTGNCVGFESSGGLTVGPTQCFYDGTNSLAPPDLNFVHRRITDFVNTSGQTGMRYDIYRSNNLATGTYTYFLN